MLKIYTITLIAVALFFSCDNGKDKVVIDQSLVMPASENKTTTAVPADAALQNTVNTQHTITTQHEHTIVITTQA